MKKEIEDSIEVRAAASSFSSEKEYWLNQLSGELARSHFPYDNGAEGAVPYVGEDKKFRLDPGQLAGLLQLSAATDAKLFVVLTTLLVALLARYSGRDDVIVGAPVLKQENQGNFVNTALALRNRVENRQTFKELLLQVKETVVKAVKNQNYPIELLLSQLELKVSGDGFPLFDTLILLENIHDSGFKKHMKPNIIFSFRRTDRSVDGSIEYNRSLYRDATIERFVSHYKTLLRNSVAHLDAPVSEIDILPPEEKTKLADEFNRTDAPFPAQQTVQQLFEEQVDKTPQRTAVVFEDHAVTYAELDKRANRLAHFLVAGKKIGPDDPVGILMERSVEQVAAILGVLKAGGAYLPIDTSYPERRMAHLIDDAEIGVIVSQKRHVRIINRLQWACPSVEAFLAVDSGSIYLEDETEKCELMDTKLWDYVAESATDDITGGGWFSSYTGDPLSKEEMDEYGDNVLEKLTPLLHKEMRVLEIGCASGITMYRVAPKVAYYHGIDLSPAIIEKNKQRVKEEGHTNIELSCMAAHEIDRVSQGDFDLVIINSVIQSFHGHNYLRKVVAKAIHLLKNRGYLFVGDVMDQDSKEELIEELMAFKRSHKDKNFKTKADWSTELFISRLFFEDLRVEFPAIRRVTFSDKIHTIANELTKFRYDTLLDIDKEKAAAEKDRLPARHKYQHDLRDLEKCPVERVAAGAGPNHLAYIIYTSGTTGKPKGVMVEHRNVGNLVCGLRERIYKNYGDGLRVCVLAPYVFDASVQQIFGVLLQGHTLHIVPEAVRGDGARLLDFYGKNRVDISDGAPIHIRLMSESIRDGDADSKGGPLPPVKHFIIGGEALPKPVVEDFLNRFPGDGPKITNIYGPAECCVDAVSYEVSRENLDRFDTIPIGAPLPNHRVYILDGKNRLQPLGAAGELCIGGAGVSRGYLKREELTAEKFCPDPFRSGGRMYRTGDLAKWLPEGIIAFLGRVDHQVKIRGFRIELGEIENQLCRYDEIKEAVVIDKEDKNGDKYLCAYLLSERECTVSELREYLSEFLPDYMIPSYFVSLKEFPLTLSGKVDRRALPEPEGLSLESGIEYVPPSNEIEEKLVDIWKKVLGRNRIGINENFFMIGGDSIKSIQIAARMNKAGYSVEIKDIFRNPSIAELAPLVKTAQRLADQAAVSGAVPLTPIQRSFFENQRIDAHHFNQAMMLYSEEGFDENGLRAVFTKIQEHHDVLRMTFSREKGQGREKGEIIQTNRGLDFPLSLQVFDFKNRSDPRQALAAGVDRLQAGIDLEEGPLMKLGLFRLDDGDRLLIVIHHLVIDGVSWRILLEDIENLYRQYERGEDLELPPKSDSFKKWAEKLSAYADSEAFREEIDYWRAMEASVVPGIERDFPGSDNHTGDTAILSFSLSEEETERLLTRVNEPFGTEINDILLAALALGIKKTCGHSRVLIAMEGHGREEILEDVNVNRTVGWFTSEYPVLLDVSFSDDLSRQIKEVKESLRRLPHKGIGYGIFKYLTSDAYKTDMEFRLKPQISFNYWGQFDTDTPGEQPAFGIAREPSGEAMSPQALRQYDFDVAGMVTDKRLALAVTYNQKHYKAETVEKLLEDFKGELLAVVAFCSARKGRELTPSDLTYDRLTIEEVETVDRSLGLGNGGNIEDIYTLSPMQEGMLFHALHDEGSAAYFQQISFRLAGELDLPLVKKSLNELFKRHDVLRTTFIHDRFQRPLQAVLKERQIDFYYEDIRPPAQAEKKEIFVQRFKEKDRKRSFDLSRDVLMRVAVIQTGDREYEFVWSHHHILMDGWCMGILISEYLEIYNASLESRVYRLAAVTPYRKYIAWLEQQDKGKSTRYWEKYLRHYEETAVLPDRKNTYLPGSAEFCGEEAVLQVEAKKTGALNELAGRNRVTMNILVQAVWGILLGRYNGKQDVVFGAVVSGRPSEIAGVESMIGLFINTIPVRIDYEGGRQFCRLLREVQEDALESESFHYFPLVEIQARSVLKQNLINHILAFENFPIVEQIDGMHALDRSEKGNRNKALETSGVELFEQTNYDFNIMASARDRLYVKIEYDGNAYEGDGVKRILAHMERVFDQILENERITVEEIDILTETERRQILYEFNDSSAEYPATQTIPGVFEGQAEKTPHKIALDFLGSQITYNHLQERAFRLAGALRLKGLDVNDTVGVLVERSLEMVTALLGVLKAGGAYLPIDTKYPEERIRYMLRDSRPGMIVTRRDSPGDLEQVEFEGSVVDVDDPSYYEVECRLPDPAVPPSSSDPAYVIYTSGSTGRPKGVLVEHRGVLRLAINPNYVHLSAGDRLLLTGSLSFDLTTFEIWGPLLNGLGLYLVPEPMVLDVEKLGLTLAKNRISILHLIPQLFDQAAARQMEIFAGITQFLIGGDLVGPKYINELRHRYPYIKISHMYGPTENTTFSTYFSVRQDYRAGIPIGKPVSNSTVYILDRFGKLQPVGAVGELCVGGDGIARGYVNRPLLTDEKFAVDPFGNGERNGEKLYKTGDLGRWLTDGNLEFLGRIDDQVKIRGVRVEPGEIAAQLLGHRQIKEAVVTAGEREGEKYLCAYYVSEGKIEISELRGFLSRTLPDYSIPSFFVPLESIPLTANGKVDRRALPTPEPGADRERVGPRDEVESKLLDVWAEILAIQKDTLGIECDFFERGGHSLKATILAARIHKEFDVKVPLAEIFKVPTVKGLAAYIKGASQDKYTSLEPVEKKEYYRLSSAQKRMHILQQMDVESTAYNISQVLFLDKEIDKGGLGRVFDDLIARHESLRTSFITVDEEPVQRVHDTCVLEVEYYDAVNQPAKEQWVQQVMNDFVRPFDLSRAPLLRLGLVTMGRRSHILVADLHHIISDGISSEILVGDFMALYKGGTLPGLRIQYKDYAEWQNDFMESGGIKKQETYWLKVFSGELPVLRLPTDFPRPSVIDFAGDRTGGEIGREETAKLREIAKENGGTLFMMLLAIYNVLLFKYTGQEDIIVGTPVSGRSHHDLNDIVGMFVNMVGLRSFPLYSKRFVDFLKDVIDCTVQAFENQDFQFDVLVEKLGSRSDISRHPVFDVIFALDKFDGEAAESPEAGTGPAGSDDAPSTYENRTSKFDLQLGVLEMEDRASFEFEYRTALFKKETVEMMSGHLKNIIGEVIENPGIEISDIQMVREEERDKITKEVLDVESQKGNGEAKDNLKVDLNF